MREIKFRAWDKEMGTMHYATLDNLILHNKHHIQNFYWNTSILMQYTGLKDKNGKEMYEGDVLKADSMPMNNGTTEVYTPIFKIVYEEYDTAFSAYDIRIKCWVKLNALNYEVIGNVYENPELLEIK